MLSPVREVILRADSFFPAIDSLPQCPEKPLLLTKDDIFSSPIRLEMESGEALPSGQGVSGYRQHRSKNQYRTELASIHVLFTFRACGKTAVALFLLASLPRRATA